jgi:uncharacterized membrane protein YczE
MTGVPVLGSAGMALRLTVTPTSTFMAVLPDVVTIPGYLLLLAGMLRLVRARQGTTPGTALDGGLMAVAALVVSWSVLITPVFHTPDMPLAFKLVNVAYPTISVAVLFVAVLLAMNEVTTIPAFWRLGVAWVSLLLGDVVYALASIGTNTLPLWAANPDGQAGQALRAQPLPGRRRRPRPAGRRRGPAGRPRRR